MLEQHRRALEAEEARAARLADEVAALRIELDQAIEAEIGARPDRSPFENVSSAPHRVNKKLLAKQAELEGVDKLLPARREILSGFERVERAKEADARLAEAKDWKAQHALLWADAQATYAELVAGYDRLRALEDRMQSWYDGNEAASQGDPDFASAWAAAKHEHGLENLYDGSSWENPPLFPQSIPTFSKVLEHARREHATQAPEPTRYVWVGPDDEIDVSTDHMKWSHLPGLPDQPGRRGDGDGRASTFRKAIEVGLIDEDG